MIDIIFTIIEGIISFFNKKRKEIKPSSLPKVDTNLTNSTVEGNIINIITINNFYGNKNNK